MKNVGPSSLFATAINMHTIHKLNRLQLINLSLLTCSLILFCQVLVVFKSRMRQAQIFGLLEDVISKRKKKIHVLEFIPNFYFILYASRKRTCLSIRYTTVNRCMQLYTN